MRASEVVARLLDLWRSELIVRLQIPPRATEMKLCKDCKWCLPDKSWVLRLFGRQFEFAKCGLAPKPQRTDPVTGRRSGGGFWSCISERMSDGTCGLEGRLFRAKGVPCSEEERRSTY
jgi:hypothetical protein